MTDGTSTILLIVVGAILIGGCVWAYWMENHGKKTDKS